MRHQPNFGGWKLCYHSQQHKHGAAHLLVVHAGSTNRDVILERPDFECYALTTFDNDSGRVLASYRRIQSHGKFPGGQGEADLSANRMASRRISNFTLVGKVSRIVPAANR